MTIDQFVTILTAIIYFLIFVAVTIKAAQQPLRANLDIAFFFAIPTLILLLSAITSFGLIAPDALPAGWSLILLLVMVYPLLRLVDDFSGLPFWVMRLAEIALVGLALLRLVVNQTQLTWSYVVDMVYLVAPLLYATYAFVQQARLSSGVTKRRMNAAATGAASLGVLFIAIGITLVTPDVDRVSRQIYDACMLISAFSFFVAFATPGLLRRAWQEPELRAFLGRAATLPRLPNTQAIIRELERGAANSLGAPGAFISLWDDKKQQLQLSADKLAIEIAPDNQTATGSAYLQQKAIFQPKLAPASPAHQIFPERNNIKSTMSAPITAGKERIGVLTVYGERAPIFADEDMALLQLLADQAAVILESRSLIDQAARVQAMEQMALLKEDFLSAAAHDLKTPLTILVAQTELLERRALRNPEAPVDLNGLRKLKKETYRLKELVLEFLDAAMAEQGKLLGDFRQVDLVVSAQETCERHSSERHQCRVYAKDPLIGIYDPKRIQQLLENLVENAVKYSPQGGLVRIDVWQEDGRNHLTVSDNGIGIPKEDLPFVFERFHRGTNVDDKAFSGMGLGLYICQGIVEQHGGRIWVESNRAFSLDGDGKNNVNSSTKNGYNAKGSTFHVELPPAAPAANIIGRVASGATQERVG